MSSNRQGSDKRKKSSSRRAKKKDKGSTSGTDGKFLSRVCELLREDKVERLILTGEWIGDDGGVKLAKALKIPEKELLASMDGDEDAHSFKDAFEGYDEMESNNVAAAGSTLTRADDDDHFENSLERIQDRDDESDAKMPAETNDEHGYSERKRRRNIIDIRLGLNDIADEGVLALTRSLRPHTQLESLALSSNKVADAGAVDLAHSILEDNPSIRSVLLDRNLIGNEGVAAITDALQIRNEIHRLNPVHINLKRCQPGVTDTDVQHRFDRFNVSTKSGRMQATFPCSDCPADSARQGIFCADEYFDSDDDESDDDENDEESDSDSSDYEDEVKAVNSDRRTFLCRECLMRRKEQGRLTDELGRHMKEEYKVLADYILEQQARRSNKLEAQMSIFIEQMDEVQRKVGLIHQQTTQIQHGVSELQANLRRYVDALAGLGEAECPRLVYMVVGSDDPTANDSWNGQLNPDPFHVETNNGRNRQLQNGQQSTPPPQPIRPAKPSFSERVMKKFFYIRIKIFFVCEETFRLVDPPLVLRVRRQWVKKVAPLVKFSAMTLRVAALACGLPVPLFIVGPSSSPNNGHDMRQIERMVDGQMDPSDREKVERFCDSMQRADASGGAGDRRVVRLMTPAYKAIAAQACKSKHSGWKRNMSKKLASDVSTMDRNGMSLPEQQWLWVRKEEEPADGNG